MGKKNYLLLILALAFSLQIFAIALSMGEEQPTSNLNSRVGNNEGLNFYDKGFLNDPIMQTDIDSLKAILDQHISKVREGSIGGFDSAGGACGCN